MNYIESANNEKFKRVRHLASLPPTKLRGVGLAFCEGLHLAQSIAIPLIKHIKEVWIPEDRLDNKEIIDLTNQMPDLDSVFVIPSFLYAKLSKLKSPQGPFIVFEPPQFQSIQPDVDILLLDAVQDPGNVGSLMRVAAAAGLTHVICANGTAWPWSDKALRAGMGAQSALRIAQPDDRESLFAILKGRRIYLTHLSPECQDLYNLDLSDPTVWVFGNEGAGVSSDLIELSHSQVRIPQSSVVESLNVATSCAVVLFEQRRQRLSL